jgi:hypothetical protein
MRRSKRSSPLDGIDLDEEYRPLSCPNCGAEREGEYCHDCGQRYMKVRLTGWELWWIFADRFLDWEEGVWRTFLKMATSPGTVIRHYLGGKRKTYLNPFSYVLFCAGLYVLGQFLLRRLSGMTSVPGIEEMQEWGWALNNAEDQFTLIAYGTVGAVALMAVAMRVMFDGQLLNAMEAVVTSLYASGNVFLLSLLISVVEIGATGDPLPARGLVGSFIVLFPICVGHAGLGLFEDWGMACYTAMTPILAAVLGFGVFLIGVGLSGLLIQMVEGVITGSVGPIIGGAVVLLLVLGPALAPFLIDISG